MPGTEILVDTPAFFALARGDERVLKVLADFEIVSMAMFTLGELDFGAGKTVMPGEYRARVRELLGSFRLLIPDDETAELYTEVYDELRLRQSPMPRNDMWTAALAIQFGLPLLTRGGFWRDITRLQVRNW